MGKTCISLVGFLAVSLLPMVACHEPEYEESRALRVGLHRAPTHFDPHLQNERVSQTVLANVFESLVGFDQDLGVVPVLAERWENPDELTWLFTLRDAVFHDQSPVSADDVVFSLLRARNHEESRQAGSLIAVDAIRAIAPQTVEVKTRVSSPQFLNKLTSIAIVPRNSPDQIVELIGSGRYQVTFRSEDRLALKAFPEHRDGHPTWDQVEFLYLPDREERIRQLLAGDLDLVTRLLPKDRATFADSQEASLVSEPGTGVTFLFVNARFEPFDDRRVRAAIHWALDREAIVRKTRHGFGEPLGQMATNKVFGFVPGLKAPTRDLERSQRLLSEAGFSEGLVLRLEHTPSLDLSLIRAQLAEAGIEVELVALEPRELYDRLNAGEVASSYLALVGTGGDTATVLDGAAHSPSVEQGYGENNWTGYADPELDRLIEASAETSHLRARRALLQESMKRWMESYVVLPIHSQIDLYGIGKEIDWDPRPDALLLMAEVGRSSPKNP